MHTLVFHLMQINHNIDFTDKESFNTMITIKDYIMNVTSHYNKFMTSNIIYGGIDLSDGYTGVPSNANKSSPVCILPPFSLILPKAPCDGRYCFILNKAISILSNGSHQSLLYFYGYGYRIFLEINTEKGLDIYKNRIKEKNINYYIQIFIITWGNFIRWIFKIKKTGRIDFFI